MGQGISDISARQIWDWIFVTLILAVVFFVLLQFVGEQVRDILETVRSFLTNLATS